MNPILVLLKKDFALLLKDKTAIALTFIVPFAMIYLFGQIFHVNSSNPGPSGIPVAVVNQSDNPAAGSSSTRSRRRSPSGSSLTS